VAEEEPAQVTATPPDTDPAADDCLALLRAHAPWLCAPELAVCVVGSQALRIACRRAGLTEPRPGDLDLAWGLDATAGAALLQRHGTLLPTTTGNQDRGTLALKLAGRRIEITTFRAGRPDAPVAARIAADVAERDMTIGAVAVELADGRVHDPQHGLQHWRERRIVAVGDPAARVREHPVRWLRYYRKAHELGFALDRPIRAVDLDPCLLLELPPEAVALELRAILLRCASPGRCLLELHEDGLLTTLAPELAPQFDGRPAGPQRWHPEVSQALHLVLALEQAARHADRLDERDRLAVLLAVLCHDLGKNLTEVADLPGHHGHEHAGLPLVRAFLARWPGLADPRATSLALDVCALHQQLRTFEELRHGTLAGLYERHFRARDYPIDLFARALAADEAGRLGCGETWAAAHRRVTDDLAWLRTAAGSVDAGAVRAAFPDDLERFRAALHEARSRAIAAHRRDRRDGGDGVTAAPT
jgi:tRNA nucleotidyltransferase (CCA-adding enzyme)